MASAMGKMAGGKAQAGAAHGGVWQQAEAAAEALGPLRLGRGLKPRGPAGEHRRHAAGTGSEFWDYRQLLPGEAASERIDWRRSALGDTLHVRRHQQQAPRRLALWIDQSPSMDFRSASGLPSKAERALILVLTLGLASLAADESLLLPGLAQAGQAGLERLAAGARLADLADAAAFARAHGQVLVLAGDFLTDAETLARCVDTLAASGTRGLLLHVCDPAEAAFPYSGDILFSGTEGETERRVEDAAGARAAYLAAWAAHCEALRQLGRRWHWTYLTCVTDEAPAMALGAAAHWLGDS